MLSKRGALLCFFDHLNERRASRQCASPVARVADVAVALRAIAALAGSVRIQNHDASAVRARNRRGLVGCGTRHSVADVEVAFTAALRVHSADWAQRVSAAAGTK